MLPTRIATGLTSSPASGTVPKVCDTRGAVAMPATRLMTRASVSRLSARRRVWSSRQSGTPQARMAATAMNESWKLMSPSQAGFHSSIPKPAAASALSATYSDAEASANWSIVHITAARTALGGNPTAATNSQMQTVASRLRTKCPRCSSGSHHSMRLTSAKTMPVCSPETASRCDSPLRE